MMSLPLAQITNILVFKDVACESLVDSNFIEIARKAMPGVDFLHKEFDAAKTSTQGGCE
jgi:hypothetical protein